MGLENLKKAPGSTHATKRLGRGQGSGLGKTAGRGGKGQTARTGSHEKEASRAVSSRFSEGFQR